MHEEQSASTEWTELSHAGKLWSYNADELALFDREDGQFHFLAFHGLCSPTAESVRNFIDQR